MKVRHKNHPEEVHQASEFDMHALSEVNMHDYNAFFYELDVFIEAKQEWVDFRQALKNHDLITNNYNTTFFEPKTKEERDKGYRL